MVYAAFARIPVPHATSITQPAGRTLVNFPTIFYTHAAAFDRTITLLGQHLTLHIYPATFTWTHGDGTTATTTGPGAAYPAMEITHSYQHAHLDVRHHLTITWAATYRIGNDAAQPVPGTVTTTGPDTTLHISEATPVLTGAR